MLSLFDPEGNLIRAKRPYRRAKLFGASKLNRLILDAMRKSDRPMKRLRSSLASSRT